MRLTRRDWEILGLVHTTWWENWLESLGYKCTDHDEERHKVAVYRNNLKELWLPLDKSMGDYARRLSETIEDVAAQNPSRSILCELAVLFMSSLDPKSYGEDPLTALEVADELVRRLDGQGGRRR